MRRIWIQPWLLCLGLATVNAGAEVPRFAALQLDPARSEAGFTVKVLWLIGLHGEFGALRGSLAIDRFRGTARVDALIDTDTLHMRSKNYEAWARSAEFFDAQQYPQIHFVSADFPLVRLRTGGVVDGVLSVRGITKPERLRIQPAECAEPLSGACSVRAEGRIERDDFGMHSRRGTLANTVELRMRIFFAPQDATPP
ncbi:MAG: YceI family protein [Rudaea sp.]